jgi:hypothetical protein
MRKAADVILVGTVTKALREDLLDPRRLTRVTIRPEMIWKSPIPLAEEYAVFTSDGCAVSFQLGSTYLVYAMLDKDRLMTDVCLGTARTDTRKGDIKKLGKPIRIVRNHNALSSSNPNTLFDFPIFPWLATKGCVLRFESIHRS